MQNWSLKSLLGWGDPKDNGGGLSQEEINMMWLIVILVPVIIVIFFFIYRSYQKSQRTPKHIKTPDQQGKLSPSQFEDKSNNIQAIIAGYSDFVQFQPIYFN